MQVCRLQIERFRGIAAADLWLTDHCVILGANNTGKSAIVDALGLVLGREQAVRSLGEYDFFGGSPTATDRIRIIASIIGFPSQEPSNAIDWFNSHDGGVPLWVNRKSRKGSYEGPLEKEDLLAIEICFAARFNYETLEVECKRYFPTSACDPFEEDQPQVGKERLNSLGYFLLPSNRTHWDKYVSLGSELFRKIVTLEECFPAQSLIDIQAGLRDPLVKLEDHPEFKKLLERASAELAPFIGTKEAKLQFRVTAGDTASLREAVIPFLMSKANSIIPLNRNGSAVRSLQLLLLLLQIGEARTRKDKNFILGIEEPELHLHPGHHRRVVA